MRGRKPKPVEQRRLEGGDVSHRPLPAPVTVAGRPEVEELPVPAGLDAHAADFWQDAVVQLTEAGVIDRIDVPVLEQMALQFSRIRTAQTVIAEFGFFTTGSTGQVREHPALKIEREATSLFLKMAEQYALTPVARTRLGLAHLQARSLAQEMDAALDGPERPQGDVIDVDVVEDDGDLGLPGI